MDQTLVQPPTVEPISLEQALDHLRADDDSAQHDLIRGLIRSAREYVEGYTRRALVRQVWKATLSFFPIVIELPVVPVRSVTSIQYVDPQGVTQTWAVAEYQVDLLSSDRVRIRPVFGETWPTIQPSTFNAVTIEFVAGHAVPFTTNFSADANQLDAVAHPFVNGDALQLRNSGGVLPDGLKDLTNYFVINAIADAFELSTTVAGLPEVLTSDGKGTQFAGLIPEPIITAMLLLIGHWYENREDTVSGPSVTEIPRGVDSLLLPYTSVRF